MAMICIFQGSWGRTWHVMDEEQAGWPPQNSPQPKWQWYVSFRGLWGRIWHVMMRNKQAGPPKKGTLPNLNGNDMIWYDMIWYDMYLSGVMGKMVILQSYRQFVVASLNVSVSIPGYRPDPLNFSAESHRCAGDTGPLCWREPIQQELPSLHFLWATTVCYCGMAKCQCCHELQIWMNIESACLISGC